MSSKSYEQGKLINIHILPIHYAHNRKLGFERNKSFLTNIIRISNIKSVVFNHMLKQEMSAKVQ